MSQQKSPRELADDVFRHELKASEAITTLFEGDSIEDAETAILESAKNILEKSSDKRNQKKVITLCYQFGQSFESEKLVGFSERAMKRLEGVDE